VEDETFEEYLARAKIEGRITVDGRIISDGEYIDLDEAAARSGIPRATLYSWARKRWVRSIKDFHGDSLHEKWQVLDVDLERKIGRRLRPHGFALKYELEQLNELTAVIRTLDATTSPESKKLVDELTFVAKWLDDLQRRVGLQERTV